MSDIRRGLLPERLLFVALGAGVFASCWMLLDGVAAQAGSVPWLTTDRILIAVGTALLLTLGFAGRAGAVGAIAGGIMFFTWIGSAALDPTSIGWLLRNDWAQHYASWESYRAAPWTWPPGQIQTLWYPVGTTVMYTDALPLFAFFFKCIGSMLPPTFQYIGLWFLISCVPQGAFAALLVYQFSRRMDAVLCGCLLFLLAPIFLGRFVHDTLSAHWLLLAGLWLHFRRQPCPWYAEAWPWSLLATIAALVHPYLAVMFLIVSIAHWTQRVIVDRARDALRAVAVVAIACALILVCWYLSGAFQIHYEDGPGGLPYGKYSFNLLGFFIPQGFSRVVPSIPLADPAQWEGSAYLGLGVLTLIVILGADALLRRRKLAWPRGQWPLVAISLLMLVFATSTVLTIGPWKLTDHPVTSPVLATFRASGRFIWIPYYLILLGAIVATLRRFPAVASQLLTLAVLADIWEFSLMHEHFVQLRTGADWQEPQRLLNDPGWDELATGRHHLTMLPPIACGKQAGPYLPFQLFAARHSMDFNSGYLARWDLKATQDYCAQLTRTIDAHEFSKDDLYVVEADWAEKLAGGDFVCHMLDGYRVCALSL